MNRRRRLPFNHAPVVEALFLGLLAAFWILVVWPMLTGAPVEIKI